MLSKVPTFAPQVAATYSGSMIYSKFGSQLTLVSKIEGEAGRVSVQATVDGTADIHDYNVSDLKADDGPPEINAAVAKLPLKIFENKSGRRRKPF